MAYFRYYDSICSIGFMIGVCLCLAQHIFSRHNCLPCWSHSVCTSAITMGKKAMKVVVDESADDDTSRTNVAMEKPAASACTTIVAVQSVKPDSARFDVNICPRLQDFLQGKVERNSKHTQAFNELSGSLRKKGHLKAQQTLEDARSANHW